MNEPSSDRATPAQAGDAAMALLGVAELRALRSAADEVSECHRVLRKGGLNIVGEMLRGQGSFVELEHYPDDDVFDRDTHSQFYYHAHRGMAGEHGHFHTFVRPPGMPPGIAPVTHAGEEPWPAGDQALSHLIGISMDAWGEPIGLFTTNRWVTDEAWYAAADVASLLACFRVDHAAPSWPVNRWITALFVLFRPQMVALLQARDRAVAQWAARHPGEDVFEDRRLEVTSQMPISISAQIDRVDRLLQQQARPAPGP